ncbi:MAG TPA: cupin domain-containing protein [Longimicrobiales bacterium]
MVPERGDTEPGLDRSALGAEAAMPPISACDVPAPPAPLEATCILRHDGAGWTRVRVLAYKPPSESFQGITRRVLASSEHAAFELRYFELEPGGYSTHERHRHVHVVVCHRGRGRVRLGDEVHEVGFGDVVYVAPNEPHQFLNPYAEPFGFLCIVDRERDRPQPIGG